VKLLPFMKPSELGQYHDGANVLVNFAQGQPVQIPGKVYEQIASGKELLVIAEADSDTARLCREAQTGAIVEPDDGAALLRTVKRLYQFYVVEGRAFAAADGTAQRYSRGGQNRLYATLIEQVLSGQAAHQAHSVR
jgi:hypothetical protein